MDDHQPDTVNYRAHLTATKNHLLGLEDVSLPPSFIPPSGCWSLTEKNAFFHALSVHSRLRPDLIAACIPNKTVADVCAYIDVLEGTSSSVSLPIGELRRELPCAMEVSDAWIEQEEREAEALAAVEPLWERNDILKQRSAERRKVKKGKENARGAVKGEFNHRLKELEAQWKKKDFLSSLGEMHLKTIDSLIRTAEESSPPSGKRRRTENSVGTLNQSPPHSMATIPLPPSTDTMQTSPQRLSSPVTINDDHTQLMDRPTASERHCDDTSTLSPASRRRYYKRMYMRRKRAEQTGKTLVMDLRKLKPGRKRESSDKGSPETTKRHSSGGKSEESEEGTESEDEDEGRDYTTGNEDDGVAVSRYAPQG